MNIKKDESKWSGNKEAEENDDRQLKQRDYDVAW